MLNVDDRRSRTQYLSLHEFLSRYGVPVLIGREVLGGELRKQARTGTRTGRVQPFNPARRGQPMRVLRQRTMTHIRPEQVPVGEMDPELVKDRRMSRELFVELRKGEETPPLKPVLIGRLHECDVLVNDYTVSGEHAHFTAGRIPGIYYLTDLGSTNGTWIDDDRLEPHQPVLLKSGQRVVMGRVVFVFFRAGDFHRYLMGESRVGVV